MNHVQHSLPGRRFLHLTAAIAGQRTKLSREARSEEILAAARAVFATKGFRGTTIADIAEEARIALGTIYNYFESKEAVFAALHQRLAEIISEATLGDAAPADTLDDTVRMRVRRVFDACGRNRDLVRLVVLNTDPDSETARRLRKANRLRAQPMIDSLQHAIELRQIRHGDASMMVRLMNGVVSFAVYDAFVLSDGEDADAYEEACADMLSAYLRPETPATN